MTKEQFENYRFRKNTQVKFNGEWSEITEVWFREGLIGVVNSGGLEDYSKIEDIRD